jgi:hypothetical protein
MDLTPYYDGPLFRQLDEKEQLEFRRWARDNYQAGDLINPVWHPVVRDECDKINREAGLQ